MPKFQAFATATGDRNSYILMEVGENVPNGYTEKMPPEPIEGYQVAWNAVNNEWQQVEILEPNGAGELPA